MDPKFLTFNRILAGRLFRIPDYQRPYSWGKRQRSELFGDILELTRLDDDRKHFMSTVVCLSTEKVKIRTDEYDKLDVVDGQQRITTLIILLKAIEKKLSITSKKKYSKEIAEIKDILVKADQNLVLLQTNHDNRGILRNYLVRGLVPDENQIFLAADINMSNAIKECEEFINDGDAEQIYTIIKNRLEFVFYILEKEETVYTVFEVLNSRGMDVDLIDKLKSVLMGLAFEKFGKSASSDHILEIKEKWTRIYEYIGHRSIPGQEIVRFAATLEKSTVPSKVMGGDEALASFKEECKKDSAKIIEYSSLLKETADSLRSLYQNRRLESVTDIIQARLLAVSIKLSKFKEPEKSELLAMWEKLSFKIYGLFNLDARTGVGDYTKLAWRIYKGCVDFSEAKRELSAVDKRYNIDTAIKQKLEFNDCYNDWEKELRYLLYRYEEHLADKNGETISNEIWESIWRSSPATTIEHIFPKNPNTPAEWRGKIGKGRDRKEKFVNCLGNLMLLPPGINSMASDKGFNEKKGIYTKYTIRMTKEITDKSEWNYKTIEDRQSKIIEWIKKTWG